MLTKLARPVFLIPFLIVIFVLSQLIGGQTWDEHIHSRSYDKIIDFADIVLSEEKAPSFDTLPRDYEYYGLLTTGPAEVITDFLTGTYYLEGTQKADIYRFLLHLSGFLWAMGTVILVHAILRRLGAHRNVAIAASAFLLLYPAWLGQSFFNYKDMPFAFFYALALYAALGMAGQDRPAFRRAVALLAIAFIGAGSLKMVGIFVMFVQVLAALFYTLYPSDRIYRASVVGITAVAGFILLYIMTPVAWVEPVKFVTTAVNYMSHHEWPGCVRTAGDCIGPSRPDWSAAEYLWKWSVVRLPLSILLLIAPAALFLLMRRKLQELFVLASLVLPLCVIVGRDSALYDGIRHVLFLIPILVIIVFLAISSIAAARQKVRMGLYALLAINLVSFTGDDFKLFPYNYIYFNEISRDKSDPVLYELDYWGFSMREAAGHLVEGNKRPSEPVFYKASPEHLVTPFVSGPFLTTQFEELAKGKPFTQVSYTRGNLQPHPECWVSHRITRTHWLFGKPMLLSFVAICQSQ